MQRSVMRAQARGDRWGNTRTAALNVVWSSTDYPAA